MKLNQFIFPMEAHSYAKKHLHTSSIWIIILKHFSIEALTLGIPWHNLDKHYIDMLLLWTYIYMQKNNFATKTFLELLEFQGSWNLIGQEKIRYAWP